MFWFELSLKSLIAAVSQSFMSLALVAPTKAAELYSHGVEGMTLYVMKGFHSFWQSKLECSCHESCVFRICSKITIF